MRQRDAMGADARDANFALVADLNICLLAIQDVAIEGAGDDDRNAIFKCVQTIKETVSEALARAGKDVHGPSGDGDEDALSGDVSNLLRDIGDLAEGAVRLQVAQQVTYLQKMWFVTRRVEALLVEDGVRRASALPQFLSDISRIAVEGAHHDDDEKMFKCVQIIKKKVSDALELAAASSFGPLGGGDEGDLSSDDVSILLQDIGDLAEEAVSLSATEQVATFRRIRLINRRVEALLVEWNGVRSSSAPTTMPRSSDPAASRGPSAPTVLEPQEVLVGGEVAARQLVEEHLSGLPPAPSEEQAKQLHTLGQLNRIQGRLAEAEQQYERALEIMERLHGDADHPQIPQILFAMGQLKGDRADFDEAMILMEKAFDMQLRLDGGGLTSSSASIMMGMVSVARKLGKFTEAEKGLLTVVAVRRQLANCGTIRAIPEQGKRADVMLASALYSLGALYLDRDDQEMVKKAEEALMESLSIFDQVVLGLDDADAASHAAALLTALGSLREYQGRNSEAEGFYQRSVALARLVGSDQGHPAIAHSLRGLGNFLCRQGRPEAQRFLEESWRIFKDLYGDDHFEATNTWESLQAAEALSSSPSCVLS
ncbi:unnamed protein product [Effrenium voratum]|nr:unnamed protein product [Effrenium voratum]